MAKLDNVLMLDQDMVRIDSKVAYNTDMIR